jgi:hypothetical protein
MRNNFKQQKTNKVLDALATTFGVLSVASGTAMLFALAFINVILAGWLYPDAINSVLLSMNKPQGAVWYYCMLIGFIPFVGRWYFTLLICGLINLFV